LQTEIRERLAHAPDGVSEFTFANLYLFRKRYTYQVSISGDGLIISGEHDGKRFFMTPCGLPDKAVVLSLFAAHDFWKNIPDSILLPNRETLEGWGIGLAEDRDNFDYLYLRTDLAELSGKKFHKKRNLVNAFLNAYVPESRPMTQENVAHAVQVLDIWREEKGEIGDYVAAKEALDLFAQLGLQGKVYYINGRPVGWCLGESLAKGTMFGIHFEKGIEEYKGIYQYINQNFAASLDEQFTHINREQDLGEEGMRQAKMTYRPVGFVQKYTGLALG
jgi:hypothetical protein